MPLLAPVTAVPGRMTRARATFAVLAVVLVAGCGSSGRTVSTRQPFTDANASTVRLIVQNRNFQDARLYYYRRGARMALGVVTGKRDAEFVIDWDFPDAMRIEINLLAGLTSRRVSRRAGTGARTPRTRRSPCRYRT